VRRHLFQAILSVLAVSAATVLLRITTTQNPTTIALAFLLVVLFVAAFAELWTAVLASAVAMLCFNFFFLPPVGTFTLADPSNWIALVAFLIVATVASQLSASARARAKDATERRTEVIRLLDLSRDILLTTDRAGARDAIARSVARRFDLELVAICVPAGNGRWEVHHGGAAAPAIASAELDAALAGASGAIEFDARTRAYGGHRTIDTTAGSVTLTPVRLGTKTIGLLASASKRLDPGARDAVAGIVAIALERLQFLGERQAADLAHQRAELSSALLASLSHDLKTPLTAIRTAMSNLDTVDLSPEQRREQAGVASGQLERLTQLFDEILDMARIEAGGVQVVRRWATPAEILDAAVAHAASGLEGREVKMDAHDDTAVDLDPRLTASAVAHLLENATRYAPSGPIEIRGWTDDEGLRVDVRDFGPGLQPRELERLFEPFYRGETFRQAMPGTGMGLAITRGLLAAQGGRVWAENAPGGGARFSLRVPASVRTVDAEIRS
jgi:two-component system, OmpR family, sensor histidine kinase KdpD